MRLLIAFALLLAVAAPAAADQRLADEVARTNVWINTASFTPPVFTPGSSPCRTRVVSDPLHKPLQAKWESVPLPCFFVPSAGSDAEAVLVDKTGGRTFEFWGARYSGGAWRARWGGGDMDSAFSGAQGVRAWSKLPDGANYGVQASGLAFIPGLITVADLKAGVIRHPLHLLVPYSCATWREPATRTDTHLASDALNTCFEYGTWFRFPAGYQCATALSRVARIVCVAGRDYGMVVADQTFSNVGFRAENWKRPYPPWKFSGAPVNPYTDTTYPALNYFGCTKPPGVTDWACQPDKFNLFRGFPWVDLVEQPRVG